MELAATTDALVAEALSENPRYPNGTVFLTADATALPSMLDAIREERAFVIVLPDRTEVALEPRMDPIARLRRRLWWPLFRWRSRTTPSLVINQQDGGYDISPPDGFTLRLHHPMASLR
ncbi:MAG TPA: hypothetical protein VID29_09145 [Solirubrobacteraceae bacterium]|jgi:hypothetical protein